MTAEARRVSSRRRAPGRRLGVRAGYAATCSWRRSFWRSCCSSSRRSSLPRTSVCSVSSWSAGRSSWDWTTSLARCRTRSCCQACCAWRSSSSSRCRSCSASHSSRLSRSTAACCDSHAPSGRVFIPFAVPGVVAVLMWGYLYGDFGPFTQLARQFELPVPDFLSPDVALASLANVVTWEYTGYNMIILFTALQAIDRTLYEAAAVDGASSSRIAWSIKIRSCGRHHAHAAVLRHRVASSSSPRHSCCSASQRPSSTAPTRRTCIPTPFPSPASR